MELLIGTGNPGKISEIQSALHNLPLVIKTLKDFPHLSEAVESGGSYLENAILKASHYSRLTGICTLADDSGLEVQSLNGRPGVLTARYGGGGLSDKQRYEHLLQELADVDDRRASFQCVIAIARDSRIEIAKGRCDGRIAWSPAGSHGFGFDPVFIPEGFDQTFAQLPAKIKDQISHRGKALVQARRIIETWLRLTGTETGS